MLYLLVLTLSMNYRIARQIPKTREIPKPLNSATQINHYSTTEKASHLVDAKEIFVSLQKNVPRNSRSQTPQLFGRLLIERHDSFLQKVYDRLGINRLRTTCRQDEHVEYLMTHPIRPREEQLGLEICVKLDRLLLAVVLNRYEFNYLDLVSCNFFLLCQKANCYSHLCEIVAQSTNKDVIDVEKEYMLHSHSTLPQILYNLGTSTKEATSKLVHQFLSELNAIIVCADFILIVVFVLVKKYCISD